MSLEYPRKRRRYRRHPPEPKFLYGDPQTRNQQHDAALIADLAKRSEANDERRRARAEKHLEMERRRAAKRELATAARLQRQMDLEEFHRIQDEAWSYERQTNKRIRDEIRQDKLLRRARATTDRAFREQDNLKAYTPSYTTAELYIPEWSDVIRIGPDPKASKEQMREYYNAAKEGRHPNLDPELIASIENKKRKMLAMKNSQVPEAFQKLGQFLTTVDNINDAMITAAWVARVGALIFPPAAPFLIPASIGLSAGATVLNALMILSPLALPQAMAKRATAKLLRKFAAKNALKAFKIPPQVAKFLPSVAEALQIAQTTADTVGFGLSLGPLYGAVQEAFFRLGVNPLDKALGNPVSGLSAMSLKALTSISELFCFGSLFRPLDHLEDLVVLWASLCLLTTPEVQAAMPLMLGNSLDSIMVTDYITDPANREMMLAEGLDPDEEPNFLYPGAGPIMYIDESFEGFRELLIHNLTDWIPELHDPFLQMFAGVLLNECCEMLMRLMGGADTEIVESLDPEGETMQALMHYGLLPPGGTDTQELQGYITSVMIARDRQEYPLRYHQLANIYRSYDFPWPPRPWT